MITQLYPDSAQKKALSFQLESASWIYNFGLNWRKNVWSQNTKNISKSMILDELVELFEIKETSWLKEVDPQVLRFSVDDLEKDYRDFFLKKKLFPRFRLKRGIQFMSYSLDIKIEKQFLTLPAIGRVKMNSEDQFSGDIFSVTVFKEENGDLFVEILNKDGVSERGKVPPVKKETLEEVFKPAKSNKQKRKKKEI